MKNEVFSQPDVLVLLQVGDFIMSSPVLQLGFVLVTKLRTFAGLNPCTENATDKRAQLMIQCPANIQQYFY